MTSHALFSYKNDGCKHAMSRRMHGRLPTSVRPGTLVRPWVPKRGLGDGTALWPFLGAFAWFCRNFHIPPNYVVTPCIIHNGFDITM
jgi:hypothetical protein